MERKAMRIVSTAALIAMLAFAAARAATSPEALVKQTTDQVLAALERNQAQIKQDPQAVLPLVRDIVLPHFDFELMSRLVLARHWRTATPEQQQRFVEQFRDLLIRTYGTSLAKYSGQKVNFLPMQPSPEPDRATVRTEVLQPGGPPLPVVYQLRQTKDGWKVFDVVIEGLSLVQNYRNEYASIVQQVGIDGLIKKMAARNEGKSA